MKSKVILMALALALPAAAFAQDKMMSAPSKTGADAAGKKPASWSGGGVDGILSRLDRP